MVGVDEVGRGCLAGPLLVVAARTGSSLPLTVKDSKLLTREQRESMCEQLLLCCQFGEGWVSSVEIDRLGLARAMRLGVRRALANLPANDDEEIVIDGNVNYLPKKFKNGYCLIDADDKVPLVSAASVYAKVTRDRFMINLAKRHPRYSFDNHVGYGTAEHYQALDAYGPLKFIHRLSFAPLKLGYENE